jgi:hypothetical protein
MVNRCEDRFRGFLYRWWSRARLQTIKLQDKHGHQHP